MSGDPHLELGESLPRFLSHWLAACFGHFLMVLLPLITDWAHVKNATWPSWWSLLLFAASTSLVAAIINANLPVTPREMIKSVALGFALNATIVMLRLA
ncbi:hypothetical protein C8J42_10683 [Sphingomonas sp. PP-CE-1A-559]|jgi:hypothetical protein|uniref:Uncharacterized protein n=1 Tax=Sphingomonas faeni TaxID=185950 RepID=A0A2T5UAR9_9SPHN|nr:MULTISPECIES: hypothetical protein [Sphingomonas]KQN03418.1 hypothetical protein ASE82_07740 [Sphingomonas sp. Leaf230]PTW48592.1 hypothetical protein C8J25_10189 [Sphingomonas faeni]RZM20130.1 MAG: hypothetical protein EOP67_55170 [Sphingomonas sp.]TCP88611.1 hypothetical protein C8J42_10683 [Sphingomonas sp. PP-CE-1A-559]